MHPRPPCVGVTTADPRSEAIPARFDLHLKPRLQPIVVIILGKKLTIPVVQPQHRIRAIAGNSVSTGRKDRSGIKLIPVVGCLGDADVLRAGCRCDEKKK